MINLSVHHRVCSRRRRRGLHITTSMWPGSISTAPNLNALVGLARAGRYRRRCQATSILHKNLCPFRMAAGGAGHGPIGVKGPSDAAFSAWVTQRRWQRPGCGVSRSVSGRRRSCRSSWAYCLEMGGEGLTQATKIRDPERQYIAARLEGKLNGHYSTHRPRAGVAA